jgi:hypothetical protein
MEAPKAQSYSSQPTRDQHTVDGRVRPSVATANLASLRAELHAVDAKIAHLTAAVEQGAAVAPLVAQLQARHAERERLLGAIAATEARQATAINRRAVQERVRAQVAQWRTLLTTSVADGRQVMREELRGPIRFTPNEATREYRFEGPLDMERLISGTVACAPSVASPRATATSREPGFPIGIDFAYVLKVA